MICRVLVAIDSADDLPLVDTACRLAEEHHATLEVVGGIACASFTVSLVACPRALNQELERYSRAILAEAIDRVPDDQPVVWRHVRGCARRRLLRDAAGDETTLLVLRDLPRWARGPRHGARPLVVLRGDPPPGAAAGEGGLSEGAATPARA